MIAERRHQNQRLKAKRKGNPSAVNTPTPCSCFMCGNPRKFFGQRTVQERRFMQVIA